MQPAPTLLLFLLLTSASCTTSIDDSQPSKEDGSNSPDTGGADAGSEEQRPHGDFSLLTYNVAALPEIISDGNPETNVALISPLLNGFEMVFVQEDFSYHQELVEATNFSQQTDGNGSSLSLGDGLNRFSNYPFVDFDRAEWNDCSGVFGKKFDCLTPKGFSVARHTVAPGVEIDIYNTHFDAGRHSDDARARTNQAEQLFAAIDEVSPPIPFIIVGDTNMKQDDEEFLVELLSNQDLLDSCRTLNCPVPEYHDRVLMRGTDELALEALSWERPTNFVDDEGAPLSDHLPVHVVVQWTQL